jgi:hypothetical protein
MKINRLDSKISGMSQYLISAQSSVGGFSLNLLGFDPEKSFPGRSRLKQTWAIAQEDSPKE